LALQAFFSTHAQQSNEPAIDFAQPQRHFRVPNPARLSDADAMSIYDRIRDDMVSAYRLSRAGSSESTSTTSQSAFTW
jgi:hypothetical protein